MDELLENIKNIVHGFKHIIEAGNIVMNDISIDYWEYAKSLLGDGRYQVRMLATYLLGQLSVENKKALEILETKVAKDDNWRIFC